MSHQLAVELQNANPAPMDAAESSTGAAGITYRLQSDVPLYRQNIKRIRALQRWSPTALSRAIEEQLQKIDALCSKSGKKTSGNRGGKQSGDAVSSSSSGLAQQAVQHRTIAEGIEAFLLSGLDDGTSGAGDGVASATPDRVALAKGKA